MDLTEIQYSSFQKDAVHSGKTTQQPSLNNYISPKDEFYSQNIQFPIKPTRVQFEHTTMDKEMAHYPLPITKEGYMNIDNIRNDSFVELTDYKMNYPGQGSLVDLHKLLEQLKVANIPIEKSGTAIYEGFADLDKDAYTEESILYNPDGVVSRFYIASISVVGLLILYRMMKL